MSKYNLFVKENALGTSMDATVYDPAMKQSQILVEADVIDDLTTPSTTKPVSANQVIGLANRIDSLEGTLYEYEIFENITTGTAGTVTIPTGATIRLDQYIEGQDCLIAKTDSQGRPVDDIAREADGTPITGTLDSAGNYTISGTPEAYPVAIIYQVAVSGQDIGNIDLDQIVDREQLGDTELLYSSGALVEPTYTDLGNGSVTIDPVVVALFSGFDTTYKPKRYVVAGNTFTLIDNDVNYIVADYNNGSPIMRNTDDVEEIDEQTVIPLFTIVRTGTTLHTISWDTLGKNKADKLHMSIVKTQRFRRESGLQLSVYGTRNVRTTAGIMWIGANRIPLTQVDSGTDNMSFYYHSGGVWTRSSVTQFNNSQYDDGTNLQTLTINRYAVNWIYRGVENYKHLYVLLGSGDYTLNQAQASAMPVPPDVISAHAVLVGRIIVQQGVSTPTSVVSAFAESFAGAAVRSHADLIDRDVPGNHTKLIPLTNTTTAIQITKADGATALLVADTLNMKISVIGDLDVTGTINASGMIGGAGVIINS